MKKLLIGALALCSLFAFAACTDGKCDKCGKEGDDVFNWNGDVIEYEGVSMPSYDLGGEYCMDCAEEVFYEQMGL
ncbi:MAG: hypothetical protein E7380_06590 [Clostridiales bacterium]|nr:hypothetical protein [Clostridiales bacterium]